jgi:flavorubredoxin
MAENWMAELSEVPKIDFIVSHHAEQDHSGSIPRVLERFPEAKVVVSPKAKGLLIDHLRIPETRFVTVEDGETLSLGGKTLQFIYTPWVHWPETMVTYLKKRKFCSVAIFLVLISRPPIFRKRSGPGLQAAKTYFAEIHDAFSQHH